MSEKAYLIALASQISGVREELIRQWERRYGVLHPKRTASGYRTYSDADIEVLKRLKSLTAHGVAIGQAVQMLPTIRREVKHAAEAPPKPATEEQLARWTDEILIAAAHFDQLRVDTVMGEAQLSMPPLKFYDVFLGPLLRQIGELWHAGSISVAEEHLVSQIARQRMIALLAGAPRRSKHHVVCACPAEEQHELGLLGVALHFRYAGWRVTYLGARTPAEQLARVARVGKAELVALSFIAEPRSAQYLEELAALLPKTTKVVVGGAGARELKPLIAKLGFLSADSATESLVTLESMP